MNDKRNRIIQSAIDVFRKKGIEQTKVSDIVKGAGIAQGTFYLYFSSKLAVMPSIAEVVVEKMLTEIKQETKEKVDFREQLECVIDVVFNLIEADRDIFALMYAGLAATEYLKEWEAIYEPYYLWMTEQLTEAESNGQIREKMNLSETATILIGMIESAAEQVYLYSPKEASNATSKKRELLEFSSYALGLTS